jgi:hypothetical protein
MFMHQFQLTRSKGDMKFQTSHLQFRTFNFRALLEKVLRFRFLVVILRVIGIRVQDQNIFHRALEAMPRRLAFHHGILWAEILMKANQVRVNMVQIEILEVGMLLLGSGLALISMKTILVRMHIHQIIRRHEKDHHRLLFTIDMESGRQKILQARVIMM